MFFYFYIYFSIFLQSVFLAGITSAEIQSLDADKLDAIEPAVISQLPPDTFKGLSVAQLSQLSSKQAASVTEEQKAVLSSEQKEMLLKIETDSLEYSTGNSKIILRSIFQNQAPLLLHPFLTETPLFHKWR